MKKQLIIGKSSRYHKGYFVKEFNEQLVKDCLYDLLDIIIDCYGMETVNTISKIQFVENELDEDLIEITHFVHFIEPEHGAIKKLPTHLETRYSPL
jgi:hypothetical protein